MMRVFLAFLAMLATACSQVDSDYAGMVELFNRVHSYQQPLLSKKALDYSPAGVQKRRAELAKMRQQFDRIDASEWPVAQKIDYLLVRSQLDQMEFEFRTLRTWSRDPGLYVDIVRDIPYVNLPVQGTALEELKSRLAGAPSVLAQGKANLNEGAGELAKLALRNLEMSDGVNHEQAYREAPPAGVLGWYEDLRAQAREKQPELLPLVEKAQAAVKDFHGWLKQNQARMTAPAGVGAKEYDWYLKHIHFAPYDTAAVLAAGEREWERTTAALALEQQRNKDLPPLLPAVSAEDYKQRVDAANEHVRKFIVEKRFLTIPAFADKEFDNNVPWLVRAGGKRNFWEEVQYRDPLPDKVHAGIPGHRFDLFLHERDTRPIRGKIENGARIEGWGFYLEEAMMHAGLLEERPRTRELFWIFAIARAVRNKAEVMMHTNRWTVAQAVDYMVRNVPYMNEDVARVDCEIYLREPTYGQNYQMGKLQIEQLLAEESLRLGEKFELAKFHDDFLAAGTIPISLIRWEMTGNDDQVSAFLVKQERAARKYSRKY
jgi:uncharacterized protein (DUF885 family)